jgi:hypothetical protein
MTDDANTPTVTLNNRPRRFKRRDIRGRIHEVEISPEAKVSKHERLVSTLMKSPPYELENEAQRVRNGPEARARKARGSILAIYRMTGEDPPDIMRRLLTDDEIARIPPFRCITIWE